MKRRATTGGKVGKARRRSIKRRDNHRISTLTDLEKQLRKERRENAETRRQLSEALEQQTATSEVLKVISSSPGDLTQMFETMLDKAIGICEAKFGIAFQWEGTAFRAVAFHRIPPAFYKQQRGAPLVEPVPGTALGRLVATKKAVQIADVRSEPAYQGDANRPPLLSMLVHEPSSPSRCLRKMNSSERLASTDKRFVHSPRSKSIL